MSKDVGEIVDSGTVTGKVLAKNTDPPQKKPKRKISEGTSVKRDMAFLQKKIADLEIAISEIQDAAQKIDTGEFGTLKQKVDDLEDLTMVENAGILEIKKFLEGLQTGIPEKLASLEEKMNALPDLSQLEAKISEQKGEAPEQITELVQSTKEELGKKLEESVLSMKLEIKDYKHDFEKLKQEIEEKQNSPFQTRILKELEDIKNDNLVNNSKVDALDSFVKEVSKEASELRPIINRINSKVESFDGLGGLEKAVDEKLQEIREALTVAEQLKRDGPIRELDTFLSRLREVEKKITEVMIFVKDSEQSRDDALDSRWKTEYKKLVDNLNKKFEKLENEVPDYSDDIAHIKEDAKAITDFISHFDKKLESTEQMIETLGGDLSILQGSQMAIESKTDKLTDMNISELLNRIGSLEETVDNKLPSYEAMRNLEKRMNEIEGKGSVEATTQMLNELMERIVFIESRMSALEKTLVGGGGRSYPVIIE